MSKVQNFEKKEFIINECMLFSVQAGLQTRNKNFPIYNKQPLTFSVNKDLKSQPDKTSNLKGFIFDFLKQYLAEIKEIGINEDIHLKKIQELADRLTLKFKHVLYEGRFRIGISQKIINLFLKYMWSMGEIPKTCHCPMDGIVKSLIQKEPGKTVLVDWTQLDAMNDYLDYVNAVKQIAEKDNLSITEWEFHNWERR